MHSPHEPHRIPNRPGQERRGVSTRLEVFFATTLVAALLATAALRHFVSDDALEPLVATALFCIAALLAGLALLRRRGASTRLIGLDIAGVVAALGIVISILIDPEQMVRLISTRPAME